ncbi:unnamed protein product [Calicophoron daubneyi]|uniref:Uncharacterized protein n=1 Tax=Calicophoron daubneyi TaxID=300641 RepID=A0AAV2TUQ4_CALDB
MVETENIPDSHPAKLSLPYGASKSERRIKTLTEKQLKKAIKFYRAHGFPFCYDVNLLIQDVNACKRLQEQARKRAGCPYIMLNDVSYLKKIRRELQGHLSCQLNRSYSIRKTYRPVVRHHSLSDTSYRYFFPSWYEPGYFAKIEKRFDAFRVDRSSLASKTRNKTKKKWYHRLLWLLFLRLFSSGGSVDEILNKMMPIEPDNIEEIFEIADKVLAHTRCRSAPLKRVYSSSRRKKACMSRDDPDNTDEEDQRILLEPEIGVSETETNLQYPITRDELQGSLAEDEKEEWIEEIEKLNPDSGTHSEHILTDNEVSQPSVTDQLLRSNEVQKEGTLTALDNKRRSGNVRHPTGRSETSENTSGMGQHFIQKEEFSSLRNTAEDVSTDIELEFPHSIHEDQERLTTSSSAEKKSAPNK